MPEEVIWTLAADSEPTVAAFDQIDEAAGAMGDAVEQVFASISEASAYAEEQIALLAASTGDLEVAFTDAGSAASYINEQLSLYRQGLIEAAVATDDLTVSAKANTAATEKNNVARIEASRIPPPPPKWSLPKGGAATTEEGGSLLGGLGGVVGTVGMVGGIGALIAGITAFVTSHMAGNFQEEMTQLVTGAGELQSNLKMVGDGILTMAPQVGESTKELTAGMYEIESSGQHGTQALETLKDAAEGAKVGAASLADVANGVTTEMTDYAKSHLSAAEATNTLITAVSLGKTHLGDLSNAMATVLPTAAAVGVQLRDVAGAMSTMTAEGVPAADASTYLRQMLMKLEDPSKQAVGLLKSIGLTTQQVASEMKISLPDTLQMITDHLKKKFPEGSAAYVSALATISGGSKQMQGMLDLTGEHLKTFAGNVGDITDAVKRGGKSIIGWSNIQQDFNEKIDKAREVVETLGIKIGMQLMPLIGQIVGALSPVIAAFSDWIEKTQALASAFTQIGDTFHKVFDPMQFPIATSTQKPLDTQELDRTHGNIGLKSSTPPTLRDSSDRGTGALHVQNNPMLQDTTDRATSFKAAPMDDSFDRGNAVLKTTQAPAVNPLIAALKTLSDAAQGLYKILAGSLGPAFAQIGKIVSHDLWPALQQSWQIIVQNKESFIFLGQVIGGVLLVALGLLVGVLGGVAKAIAFMLPGFTLALAGIAQFVKGVIEIFGSTFMLLKDLFTGNFGALGKDWEMFKQGIVDVVSGLVNLVIGTFEGFFGMIIGFTEGFIDTVIAFFNGLSDTLVGHSIIPDMVNKIISWFTKLPGLALQWGKDLIQNFIDGINNLTGSLQKTVSGVADKIKQFLGFSKPEQGPLADADRYGPDFIELFASGIEGSTGRLKQALSTVAGSLAANISPNVTLGGSSGGGSLSGGGSTAVFYQILQVLQQIQQQQRGGGGSISNTQNNTFNGGNVNTRDLYTLFDQVAGIRFESGLRGSI